MARDSPPRTWLFWVLPPVLCGLAMAAHCVVNVPTGEYQQRPAKKKKTTKTTKKTTKKGANKQANKPAAKKDPPPRKKPRTP